MKDIELKKVIEEYGTPTFLFDAEALKKRVNAIKAIWDEKVNLCYSIKANPFLLDTMLEVVDKLEVCSPGELDICKMRNVDGERIIYSGVNKTKENIDAAVEYEAGVYTAESILQLELLNESALSHGKVIPVLLRLNAGSQFGMSEEDLRTAIAGRIAYRGVKIVGIHYFVGTQRKKLAEQVKELEMLSKLFDEFKERYGYEVQRLEYGPGLPVPYFTTEVFEDTLAPVRELADALKKMAEKVHLTVEMGRFYVTECGYYITKVMDQKSNKGTNYAIVDGGMNHLNYLGQMMGMKIPVIRHFSMQQPKDQRLGQVENSMIQDEEVNWCLCGSLCTTADVVVRQVPFKDLTLGDVLVFENVGAYSVTEGIYLFLSRTMPRILLYHGEKKVELLRDFMETSQWNCVH